MPDRDSDHPPRRYRDDDNDNPKSTRTSSSSKYYSPDSRSREPHSDRPKESSDSRSRHRRRRRSRTPNSSSRRPRSRDERRDPSRDRDRDRQRDRERLRERSREDRQARHRRDDPSQDDKTPGSPPSHHQSRDRRRNDIKDSSSRSTLPLRRNGPLPSQANAFSITTGQEPQPLKERPNFSNSGLLAAASNSIQQNDGSTVVLKYHEPAEARKPPPKDQWKLFVFKDGAIADTVDLSARSCWLVGKDLGVADLAAEHPSVSRQHAVIQFRYVEKRDEFGDKVGRVKPYVIDLESANGTSLNHDRIPDRRYLELRHKDMVQFGNSTREYVVMLAST